MNHFWPTLITLYCLSNMVDTSGGEEQASLLAAPEVTRTKFAASSKFDDRIFAFSSEPVSASILEHNAGNQELSLNVGVKDGVQFGQAFQNLEPTSQKWIGMANIMELGVNRRCQADFIGENTSRKIH
jgi:hypothetical protein